MPILMNAIKGHDSLQKNLLQALYKKKLYHALLFTGPSGVGKKKMAWALVQSLLCPHSPSACGQCLSCRKVEHQKSEDVLFISPKTLQIKRSEVSPITPFLSLQTSSQAKVVIIEEADRLNLQSVNSLLKIIEEPPQKSFFILISSSLSALPVTLRSRFQLIRFRPLPASVIKELCPQDEAMASWGHLDFLENFKEQEELRALAFRLWNEFYNSTQLPSALDSFLPLKKKREEALFISRCWQKLLRDVRCFQAGERERFLHGNQQALIQKMSLLPSHQIDSLVQKSFELEKNLLSQLDCVLCFENFVISLRRILQKR